MKLNKFQVSKLAKYFLNGLLFLVPLSITVYVFYIIFAKVDKLFVRIPIPGVGITITVFLITMIGFLASNIVTQKYLNYIDTIFKKVPLVKLLYTSIKDLINAFVGKEKKFNRPCLINLFPDKGIKVLGFITSEGLEAVGIKDDIAVYIPQSYNFAGNLLIVPKKHVTELDIPSSRAMAIIVSAAIAGKEYGEIVEESQVDGKDLEDKE
ncbi:DUF502 domain-containing protein [bacterium]